MLSLRGREVEVLLMQPFRIHSPIGALDRGQTTKMAPILFHPSLRRRCSVQTTLLMAIEDADVPYRRDDPVSFTHSSWFRRREDTPSWPVQYKLA